MKEQVSNKWFIGVMVIVIGLIGSIMLWPEQSSSASFVNNLAQFDIFTDHHHIPEQPNLSINHNTGRQGSFFLITGTHFPVYNTVLIKVNDYLVGTAQLDGSGITQFELSTTNADNGVYFVTVTAAVDGSTGSVQVNVEPSADTVFTIQENAPLQPSEHTDPPIQVPSGIAASYESYLPTVIKE